MEGTSLKAETLLDCASGGASLAALVEAILEQSLLLSLIDTEVSPENYLLLPEGGIGFLSPAWVPVPAEWQDELLQYITASVAGNTPRALKFPHRMSSNGESYVGEHRLLVRFSSLRPELKIHSLTPESVTALENHWRALTGTALRPPLFLQLFHRNFVLLGQCNGSASPSSDLIADGPWPVLGRALPFHFEEILSTEKGKEWIASSELFLMGAARQFSAALEQFRETRGEFSEALESEKSESRNAKLNRRVACLIRSAAILVVFLLSVQLASSSKRNVTSFLAITSTVIASAALFISVERIQ